MISVTMPRFGTPGFLRFVKRALLGQIVVPLCLSASAMDAIYKWNPETKDHRIVTNKLGAVVNISEIAKRVEAGQKTSKALAS
jgi:hypothetical protein